MLTTPDLDAQYRELMLTPLRLCADYLPKMGGGVAVDFDGFTSAYNADPLYRWLGLDSELMYAAHKAAGGMTSIYRQLGIGSERLFRGVLMNTLGLSAAQVKWNYQAPSNVPGRLKTLTLDGRIQLSDLKDSAQRDRVHAWLEDQCSKLGVSMKLKGVVFEVRQGYKSADSKRQNGDLYNSAQALGHGYLMSVAIMSTQVNQAVRARYQAANIPVLMGTLGSDDSNTSTYGFFRDIVGYDLAAFFERNSEAMRSEITAILRKLLSA